MVVLVEFDELEIALANRAVGRRAARMVVRIVPVDRVAFQRPGLLEQWHEAFPVLGLLRIILDAGHLYDIQRELAAAGHTISINSLSLLLREEGFARLPRRRDDERPPTVQPETAAMADVRGLEPDPAVVLAPASGACSSSSP